MCKALLMILHEDTVTMNIVIKENEGKADSL